MDVAYDWDRLPVPKSLKEFEKAWGTFLAGYDVASELELDYDTFENFSIHYHSYY